MMRILRWSLGLLQGLLLTAVMLLEHLSGQRGGVNHHVLARRHQWSEGLLSPEHLMLLDGLLGLAALMVLGLWLRRCWGSPGRGASGCSSAVYGWALGWILLTVLSHRAPWFLELRTASYLTLAAAAATVLQLLFLGLREADASRQERKA